MKRGNWLNEDLFGYKQINYLGGIANPQERRAKWPITELFTPNEKPNLLSLHLNNAYYKTPF